MISEVSFSEYKEGLFVTIDGIFMSRESIFFIRSNLIPSSFISIVVSSFNLDASIFSPPLFLKIIF